MREQGINSGNHGAMTFIYFANLYCTQYTEEFDQVIHLVIQIPQILIELSVVIPRMFVIVLASFCLQFTYAGAEIKPGEPPLVIVSLDGMDWRVLKNHRFTPNLDFIARTGVTTDYIKNVVPSSTWPNHHSLLTGLFPKTTALWRTGSGIPSTKKCSSSASTAQTLIPSSTTTRNRYG